MRIVSITVYCNEPFRLDAWKEYYIEYREALYKHIVVNNGDEKDTKVLQDTFPDSIVLYSNNKALTSSYNLGIREAFKDPDVDAILLIGNDMKISAESVKVLYNLLYSEDTIAEVSPVILQKDSNVLEMYGAMINFKNLQFHHMHSLEKLNSIKDEVIECTGLPGGLNMAKRSVYEKCGLQDDMLFMYSDEVDTGIRYKKAGYRFLATQKAIGWHQHVNKAGVKYRDLSSFYYRGRNKIYLAKKHFDSFIVLRSFMSNIIDFLRFVKLFLRELDYHRLKEAFMFLKGTFAGLFMKVIR